MSNITKNEPPVEHRFKPGQSGNPKGRPKGALNKKNRPPKLRKTHPMDEKVDYSINGKVERITRTHALVLSARDRVFKERNPTIEALLMDLTEVLAEAEAAVDYNDWFKVIVSSGVILTNTAEGLFIDFGMMRFLYPRHPLARMMLEPWIVEIALAQLGDKRLTREQQKLVVAITRLPHTVNWPDWWDPKLRKRQRGSYQLLLDEEIRWMGGDRI